MEANPLGQYAPRRSLIGRIRELVDKTVLLHGRVDTASTLAAMREFEYRSSNIPLEEVELTRGDHRRQKQSEEISKSVRRQV
jgi:hypothetical protein